MLLFLILIIALKIWPPALPCICPVKVMRLQSTKNGEEDTILQKAHNRNHKLKKMQKRNDRIGAQDMCTKSAPKLHFNASEIAKLKARVQQLGYNVEI